MYDQFGTTDPQQANFSSDHFGPQGFHGSFDINDLFSQFGFNQGRQQRNKDIRLRMNIHFKDIFRHKKLYKIFLNCISQHCLLQ